VGVHPPDQAVIQNVIVPDGIGRHAQLVPASLKFVDGCGNASTFATSVYIERIFVMVIDNATSPRRPTRSKVASPCKASNEVERVNICACELAGPATNGVVGLADGAARQALLDAVEDQRVNLLNVLGIVHCMSANLLGAGEAFAPEVSAAFALLEQQIQRVVAGLEEVTLRDAM
jgi:hypothetical protein